MGAGPQVVDWNNDGKKDLLVANADGYIRIYLNTNTDADPQFSGYTNLKLGSVDYNNGSRGMFDVVDWNNDGKKDIVCGTYVRQVHLLLNTGTDAAPLFSEDVTLMLSGLAYRVCPSALDYDGDGRKDLVIGDSDGMFKFFRNIGTDAAPAFISDGSVPLQSNGAAASVGYYSALAFHDWDRDGRLDIVAGAYSGDVTLHMTVPEGGPPLVNNAGGAAPGAGYATLKGNLLSTGGSPTTVYTCWGTSDGGTNAAGWDYVITNGVLGAGLFEADTPSTLIYGQRYFYRTYAVNAMGACWAASSVSFLTLRPVSKGAYGALNYAYYNDAAATSLQNIDDGVANGANGGLFSLTPTDTNSWPDAVQGKAFWTGEVWQTAFIADTYCQMWWGYFHPPTSGIYQFYVHGDDYEILWIDTNENGEFEAAASEDISRNVSGEEGADTPHTETVALSHGSSYRIAFAHNEAGRGDWFNLTITTPEGDPERINPGQAGQAGWWSTDIVTPDLSLSNSAATAIVTNSAVLNAMLDGIGATYEIYAHWDTVGGGRQGTQWTNAVYVGSWTDVEAANISYTALGLKPDTTYYFAFRGTNAAETLWAPNVLSFKTTDGMAGATLTVQSAHGGQHPGTTTVGWGTALNCYLTNSPVVNGTTRYLAAGAVVAGNDCTVVNATNVTLTLTNDATLTWLWSTNYWLDITAGANGTVDQADQWVGTGSDIAVTAGPGAYYHFAGWTGDTNAITVGDNSTAGVTVTMNAPVSLVAAFAENLTSQGTPEWWLAQYGLTNGGFEVAALEDADEDGLLNWQEFKADTAPTNRASVLRLCGLGIEPGGVRVEWQGGVTVTQVLESSSLLSATGSVWTALLTNDPPTAARTNILDSGAGGRLRYYRIRVLPEL